MALSEHVIADYQTLRLSLKAHPMSFLRQDLSARRIRTCADLRGLRDGASVSIAGVVLVRQRPGTAKGVVFMTIEDETGVANAVIWSKTLEHFRKVVMGARLVLIHGRIQRHEDIIHVVAARLEDRSDWLHLLARDPREATPLDAGSSAPGHRQPAATPPGRRHPRQERIIPRSRDFH
jgi:error-prone DNA polymerase